MIDESVSQSEQSETPTGEPRWYGVFPAISNMDAPGEEEVRACCLAIPFRNETEVPIDLAAKALCTLWPGVLFSVISMQPIRYDEELKTTFLKIDSGRVIAHYRDGELVENVEARA